MKKVILAGVSMVLVFALTGCVRFYKVERERVDISVAGNQGVLHGTKPAPHTVDKTTRDIYTVDVELPTLGEIKGKIQKKKNEDVKQEDTGQKEGSVQSAGGGKAVWGNSGNMDAAAPVLIPETKKKQ
ncbi:MAG: hypothetical protein ABH825_04575, partial [Candidatus Omnitrophota bacterium]